jgi:hypothetical protein
MPRLPPWIGSAGGGSCSRPSDCSSSSTPRDVDFPRRGVTPTGGCPSLHLLRATRTPFRRRACLRLPCRRPVLFGQGSPGSDLGRLPLQEPGRRLSPGGCAPGASKSGSGCPGASVPATESSAPVFLASLLHLWIRGVPRAVFLPGRISCGSGAFVAGPPPTSRTCVAAGRAGSSRPGSPATTMGGWPRPGRPHLSAPRGGRPAEGC